MKTAPVTLCPCAKCSANPKYAVRHIGPKPKKNEPSGRYHRLNAWGARILRRLTKLGIQVEKAELVNFAFRPCYDSNIDHLELRLLVPNTKRIHKNGLRRHFCPANIEERDAEVRWMKRRYDQAMRDVSVRAYGYSYTKAAAISAIAQEKLSFHYGPTSGRWPGEEYAQDKAARLAALAFADAIERYFRLGGYEAAYTVSDRVGAAWEAYRDAARVAVHDFPAAPRSISALWNLVDDELLALMRALRGPAIFELRYPPAFPGVVRSVVRYAAETPNYRYPVEPSRHVAVAAE